MKDVDIESGIGATLVGCGVAIALSFVVKLDPSAQQLLAFFVGFPVGLALAFRLVLVSR